MRTSITAALALFITAGATAQTRVIPQNYTWALQPPDMAEASTYDGKMANMIRISVGSGVNADPVVAALAVATQAYADMTADPKRLAADGGNFCILLENWGHNDVNGASATRFFVDTLDPNDIDDNLPGVSIGSFPEDPNVPEHNKPNRPYRHPWLINATASNSALKQWTTDFVAAYVALQAINTDLPAPAAFYLDADNFIANPRGKNPVWMLHHVAGTGLWNQPVPGWGGQTAAQLYAAAASEYGWPADIRDTAAGGINPAQSAQSAINRPYMAFWCEVVQRSLDQVLAHSAYGPIKAQWPTCKVGNYGMSRMDGEEDTTSWFFARDCVDESCATFTSPKDEFSRTWIDREWYASDMFQEVNTRWIAFPQWSSGDVDAPPYSRSTTFSIRAIPASLTPGTNATTSIAGASESARA